MSTRARVLSLTVALFVGLSVGAASAQNQSAAAPVEAAPESRPPDVAPFVTSDVAELQAVIVLSVGDNIFKSSEMGGGMPIFSMGLPRGAIAEHRALIEVLEAQGVEVLDVRDLLQDALENARSQGTLAAWLREVFPATADAAIARLDEIDADSLLLRRDDHFYVHDTDGTLDPLFPGMSSMYWTRDFAASIPQGIVIGNSRRFTRSLENQLASFMFRYAERLQDFPVVFDAGAEGVNLDGGDLIVLNEETILLGVDNRTSREAAEKLAQRLDVDVIAVNLPPWDRRSGLSRQLLHLDSTFNLVDRDTIVAVPYFLEKRFAEDNPMATVLSGIARQMETWQERAEVEIGDAEAIRTTVALMPGMGWATRYAAGSGEPEPLQMKLVDWLREEGYRVVYVGGEQGALSPEKYAVERAMYELRWQGANVVQLGPGRVIAFDHNQHTNQALRDAGIEVLTFPGELLSIRGGGPHCLLMPLVRHE